MLFCLVFLDDHTVYIEKHRSYNWIAFKFNLKRDNMVKDYFLKGDKHSLEVNRTMHFLSLSVSLSIIQSKTTDVDLYQLLFFFYISTSATSVYSWFSWISWIVTQWSTGLRSTTMEAANTTASKLRVNRRNTSAYLRNISASVTPSGIWLKSKMRQSRCM